MYIYSYRKSADASRKTSSDSSAGIISDGSDVQLRAISSTQIQGTGALILNTNQSSSLTAPAPPLSASEANNVLLNKPGGEEIDYGMGEYVSIMSESRPHGNEINTVDSGNIKLYGNRPLVSPSPS